jgi:hypothetical protein
MSSPATDPGIYDVIQFDGTASPGVVKLSGHKRDQNLDVKESDGQKGATTTWKGTKIGKFTATFSLVFDPIQQIDDFVAWDSFAEKLWATVPPKSGAKPMAKDVWHPDLERNHFSSVILETMGEMVHDGKGGATIAVGLSEYYPPKPAKSGKAGSGASKEDPNDPLVVARKELEATIAAGKTP